jgi:hypothetical protein
MCVYSITIETGKHFFSEVDLCYSRNTQYFPKEKKHKATLLSSEILMVKAVRSYRLGHVLGMIRLVNLGHAHFSVWLFWVVDIFCGLKFDTLDADLDLEIGDEHNYQAEEDNTRGGCADPKAAIIFTL